MTIDGSKQATVFQEALAQVKPMADTTRHFSNSYPDLLQTGCRQVGQVSTRHMRPEVFHRVEFRRIGRKVRDGQPTTFFVNVVLNLLAPVCRKAVPQQNNLPPSNMTLQLPQILTDALLVHGSRQQPQAQSHVSGSGSSDQAGNGRQPFPVEWHDQDGRFPTRRPGSTDRRTFRKAAFIQENQPCFALPGRFFMRGQSCRSQRRTALSSRSRARRSGRWQLHFSSPRRRQT